MQHYKARLLEGEEARRTIDEYFADDAPSGEKGTTSRKDLEPFFLGRVGEKVVILFSELAQGCCRPYATSLSEIWPKTGLTTRSVSLRKPPSHSEGKFS